MTWTEGDIVLVELRQVTLDQELVNTLTYEITTWDEGTDEQDIFNSLAAYLVGAMLPIQQSTLDHVEQIFSNLTDGITQTVTIEADSGAGPGTNPAPSFVAIGMKKNVATRITRPGSLRIAGIGEEQMEGNDLQLATVIAALEMGALLDTEFATVDGEANNAVFAPVVVGRDVLGAFDLLRINEITTITTPRLTTQNSRKPNR